MFKLLGVIGIILISGGILLKNKKRQNILYVLGGICLEIYSIFLNDLIFVILQIIFVLSAFYALIKNSSQKTKKMGAGFGVMILKDNQVLLGHRHDDPEKASSLMHGEGTWTMPGGKLHFGEDLKEAALRELSEETGLKAKKEDLKVISLTNDIVFDAHFITIGFLCENFEGQPKVMEPDEITEWRWFNLNHLPQPLFLPSEKIIKNYNAGEIYQA